MTTHVSQHYDFSDPEAAYAELARDLRALPGKEYEDVYYSYGPRSLFWEALPDLNWAGFY